MSTNIPLRWSRVLVLITHATSIMNLQSFSGTLLCLSLLSVALHATEPPASVLDAQRARQASMESASRATIAVFGLDGGGGGSGVIITPDGYALTNFHVTSACGDHMRVGLADGRMVDAVIVGIDATVMFR